MSATSRARRSDSLYFDTVVSRRSLCDMIAFLESKAANMEDEMHALRCELDRLQRIVNGEEEE